MSNSILAPISPENPCGEDISVSGVLYQLNSSVAGKPETQFAPAQDPDWRAVGKQAEAVLGQCKHLSALVIYAVSQMKLRGLEGVVDGLEAVAGNVQCFWPDLYPRLDPEDNNDPTERLNILADLTAPAGAGDTIRFMERLRSMPIYKSKVLGVATLDALEVGGDSLVDQFRGAVAAEAPNEAAGLRALAQRAVDAVDSLVRFLDQVVEVRHRRSWTLLAETIKKLGAVFESSTAEAAPEGNGGNAGSLAMAASSGPASHATVNTGSGIISRHEDVILILDKLCEWYAKNEPASPVPLLLHRARNLVQKSFMDIIQDLSPEALGNLKNLAGIRE